MKIFLSKRLTYLLGFLIICSLVGVSMYLQKHDGMHPCALCILQRFSLAILGIVFLFGAIFNLKRIGGIILGLFAFLVALSGALLSGRQVWLQHLPPNPNGDCGASLQYMLQAFPLNQVVKLIIGGGAECAHVGWQFLYLSLAEWSLVWFAIFFLLALVQLFRQQ